MPSSEFIAICQAQVTLLSQLGAAWSAVYLAQQWSQGGQNKWLPVFVYPEVPVRDQPEKSSSSESVGENSSPRLATGTLLVGGREDAVLMVDSTLLLTSVGEDFLGQGLSIGAFNNGRQLVIPLGHEGVVLGLLVTKRLDRPWQKQELAQIEQISCTLALATFLDRAATNYKQQWETQQLKLWGGRDHIDDLLHQIRNPLTALRTFSKLLLKRFLPQERNHELATSLVKESDRLQDLLQQLEISLEEMTGDKTVWTVGNEPLLLAPEIKPQAIALRPTFNLEPCLLANILEPLLVSGEAIAQEKGLIWESHLIPNLPPVIGDVKALTEVFSNLIDNAIKYTPAGGCVVVSNGLEKNTPQGLMQGVAVSDTGLGIPPEDLGRVFERHYRGVQEVGGIPGTGLGLAIVSELVKGMEGAIEVISPCSDSPTISPGTKFTVWLLIIDAN